MLSVVEIGEAAFKNNNIGRLFLGGPSLRKIHKEAFMNNKIGSKKHSEDNAKLSALERERFDLINNYRGHNNHIRTEHWQNSIKNTGWRTPLIFGLYVDYIGPSAFYNNNIGVISFHGYDIKSDWSLGGTEAKTFYENPLLRFVFGYGSASGKFLQGQRANHQAYWGPERKYASEDGWIYKYNETIFNHLKSTYDKISDKSSISSTFYDDGGTHVWWQVSGWLTHSFYYTYKGQKVNISTSFLEDYKIFEIIASKQTEKRQSWFFQNFNDESMTFRTKKIWRPLQTVYEVHK